MASTRKTPMVMVELAEARIFVSADGKIDADSIAMLERAVELDPAQQKGLWLLGIAAAQAGDLEGAVSRWETLLAQLEPGSPVAQSVQTQLNEANTRLGRPTAPMAEPMAEPVAAAAAEAAAPVAQESVAPEPVADGSWRGTPVRIAAAETARASIPTGAVLFVVIRTVGPAVGPPLGVRRVIDPILPLDITISDRRQHAAGTQDLTGIRSPVAGTHFAVRFTRRGQRRLAERAGGGAAERDRYGGVDPRSAGRMTATPHVGGRFAADVDRSAARRPPTENNRRAS